MGWGLSSWYGLVRCLQILASLAASILHAVLFGHIAINNLGGGKSLPVLQGMMTALLLYSIVALALIRTGKRAEKTPWLVAAIIGDLVFIGILLAEDTILSQAGLPGNCGGLTRSNFVDGDSDEKPKPGYNSIRFTNQFGGNKGQLDRYCALSRGFFIIAIALVFTFIGSIVVEVLMVVAGGYTKNSKVEQQIQNAIRDAEKAHSKQTSLVSVGGGHQQPQQQQYHAPAVAPVAAAGPSSERPFGPPAPPDVVHRQGSAHTVPSPVSPVSPVPPHPHPHHYHQHHPAAAAYGDQMASSSSSAPPPPPRIQGGSFGYETPEDEAAAAALITDGSRANLDAAGSGLPPRYTPGTLYPMSGHAGESNEMRLSDYVKGETRAQDMKDGLR